MIIMITEEYPHQGFLMNRVLLQAFSKKAMKLQAKRPVILL